MISTRYKSSLPIVVLVTILFLAAASCSSSQDSSTAKTGEPQASEGSAGGEALDAEIAPADDSLASTGAGGTAAATAPTGGEPLRAGRSIISNADLTLEVSDASKASDKAIDAAAAAGGFLAQQEAQLADGRIAVTLRVPSERFRAVLAAIGKLGTVTEQRIDTNDVTDEVVDLEGRIGSARVSVERLRELLTRSGDVEQLSAVEGELARREAELESLLGRQRVLADQVDLATIHAELIQPDAVEPVENDDEPLPGFFGGLRGGWDGLVTAASVLVTGIGYALPFLLPLAALSLAVAWLRRRRRTKDLRG